MLDIGQVNVFHDRNTNLGSSLQIQKDEDETVTDNSNSLMTDSIPNLPNDEKKKSQRSCDFLKRYLNKRDRKAKEKNH